MHKKSETNSSTGTGLACAGLLLHEDAPAARLPQPQKLLLHPSRRQKNPMLDLCPCCKVCIGHFVQSQDLGVHCVNQTIAGLCAVQHSGDGNRLEQLGKLLLVADMTTPKCKIHEASCPRNGRPTLCL